MTSEQLEFKLNMRIALFEQQLNIQCIALRLSTIFNPNKYFIDIYNLQTAIQYLLIIKSQTIPKFKIGGLIEYGKVTSDDDVFVKGCFDKRSNKLFNGIDLSKL